MPFADFRIELDKKWWMEFRRQTKAAAGDLSDVKDLLQTALKPMADDWQRRLPGSTKRTVRIMRQSRQGIIRAGWRSKSGDHPFVPWLEFGGTVVWKTRGREMANVHLQSGVWRKRWKTFIRRPRVADGRYIGPAFESKADDVNREFADGVQRILNKHFHAPAA